MPEVMDWAKAASELADRVSDLERERDTLRAQVAAVDALADTCSAKVKQARDAGELDARDWLRDFERAIRTALAGNEAAS